MSQQVINNGLPSNKANMNVQHKELRLNRHDRGLCREMCRLYKDVCFDFCGLLTWISSHYAYCGMIIKYVNRPLLFRRGKVIHRTSYIELWILFDQYLSNT